LITETGKVDGSGGGGGGVGTTTTGAAAVFSPSAAPVAVCAAFAPATPGFSTGLFDPALAAPGWPWFATGATCARVGSCGTLLLPAVGSTPADVSPAPARADGVSAQQAASNRIREIIIGQW
jgi:hypothetical protein